MDINDQIEQEDKQEIIHNSKTFELLYARNESEKEAGISISDFEIVNLIGKGSISNVYLIKRKSDSQPFAMKCI